MRDEVCGCGSCRSVQVSVPAQRRMCSCNHFLGVVQVGVNGESRVLCSYCAKPAMLVALVHQLDRGSLRPKLFPDDVARSFDYLLRAERLMHVPMVNDEHRSAVTVLMGEYYRALECHAASQMVLE